MAKRAAKADAQTLAIEPPRVPDAPVITTLERVIGQAAAKRTLLSAISAGRMHHAWIFHGPPGVGKFTTATAFAATILDPTTAPNLSGELAPEEDSPVQRMVRAGSHPDLHVIRKELAIVSSDPLIRTRKQTNIPKAVLHEFLLDPAARTRILRGESMAAKVFIVDEAELIDPVGQNSLLKTLEEPAPGTVLILVTAFLDDLLPTIRSRCQRVAFAPLVEDDMKVWLSQSGLEVPLDRRDWLLRYAAGSPGAARLAMQHNLYTWHETLTPLLDAAARGQYSIDLGSAMHKLVEELAAAAAAADKLASKDAANKAWGRRMLAFVAEHSRAKLRARTSGTARHTPEQLEADPNVQRAIHGIEAVNRAEWHLESHVKLETVFENLAAQLVSEPIAA